MNEEFNEDCQKGQRLCCANSFLDPEPGTPTFPTWTESRKVFEATTNPTSSPDLDEGKALARQLAESYASTRASRGRRASRSSNDSLSQSRCNCAVV